METTQTKGTKSPKNTQATSDNPLLKHPEHFDGALDFPSFSTEDYLPALKEAISLTRKRITKIKESTQPSTFENTLLALEDSKEELQRVSHAYFNLLHAHGAEAHQKLAESFSSTLTVFESELSLDEGLFQRVQSLYNQYKEGSLTLEGEDARALKKIHRNFIRNGAGLTDKAKRERLREIDRELSCLRPQFAQNLLKATNAFTLHVEKEEDLKGLSLSLKEGARVLAEKKGLSGWGFNLQAPSYLPFMKYCDKESLRKQMWEAFSSRANEGEFDNREIILKMVRFRHERARLLGYKNHAEFVLEERMVKNEENLKDFLFHLLKISIPKAKAELQELEAFKKKYLSADSADSDAQENSGSPLRLQPWDVAYYSEKLKEKKFHFDSEQLRSYFSLDKVLKGLFTVAYKLFDLTFVERKDIPVYHPEAQVYEVRGKNDTYLGLMYMDFFARNEKHGGAWLTYYRRQGMYREKDRRAHVSMVCNFTPATQKGESVQLTLLEVRTLFHEFGHALHNLISECRHSFLSGSQVLWDFVELPSQIMENWMENKESLNLFAHHKETSEPIPAEWVEKIQKEQQFQGGLSNVRQLHFSLLDLFWHTKEGFEATDVRDFERGLIEKWNLPVLGENKRFSFSCTFSHIFDGGYDAGYYSYKWAENLEADAFTLFEEKGLFNKEVARQFQECILSRGDGEDPGRLYESFRGRPPNNQALLSRYGLA